MLYAYWSLVPNHWLSSSVVITVIRRIHRTVTWHNWPSFIVSRSSITSIGFCSSWMILDPAEVAKPGLPDSQRLETSSEAVSVAEHFHLDVRWRLWGLYRSCTCGISSGKEHHDVAHYLVCGCFSRVLFIMVSSESLAYNHLWQRHWLR